MKQFTLRLQKRTQRPIAKLDTFYGIDAMLDTGAVFPIWLADESLLVDMGGKLILSHAEFGGFGGSSIGKIYSLPFVQIGDLLYPDMHIIAYKMNMPCSMIISATMFQNLIYEIDDFNHRLNITIPDKQSNIRNLTIRNANGKLQVLCQSGS